MEPDAPMHAGHGYTHTTIEHHDDGSHTVTHHHAEGPEKDEIYGRHGIDDLHDGMEEHLGEPNDGEEAEDHEHESHADLLDEIEQLICEAKEK